MFLTVSTSESSKPQLWEDVGLLQPITTTQTLPLKLKASKNLPAFHKIAQWHCSLASTGQLQFSLASQEFANIPKFLTRILLTQAVASKQSVWVCFSLYLKKIFFWTAELNRKDFPSTGSLSKRPVWSGLAQAEVRTQEHLLGLHMDRRDPGTWSLLLFSRNLSTQLGQKWNSWKVSQCTYGMLTLYVVD